MRHLLYFCPAHPWPRDWSEDSISLPPAPTGSDWNRRHDASTITLWRTHNFEYPFGVAGRPPPIHTHHCTKTVTVTLLTKNTVQYRLIGGLLADLTKSRIRKIVCYNVHTTLTSNRRLCWGACKILERLENPKYGSRKGVTVMSLSWQLIAYIPSSL